MKVLEVVTDFGIVEEAVRRWMRQAIPVGAVAAGEAPAGDGERDFAQRSGLSHFFNGPKMTCLLVRDRAAVNFPVRLTCGVLGFSAQAF